MSTLCFDDSRVQLIHYEKETLLSPKQLHLLDLRDGKILLLCRVEASEFNEEEFLVKLLINIEDFDEFPCEIETLPKTALSKLNARNWIKDDALEENLFHCFVECPEGYVRE